jgi:hypothetical protein
VSTQDPTPLPEYFFGPGFTWEQASVKAITLWLIRTALVGWSLGLFLGYVAKRIL